MGGIKKAIIACITVTIYVVLLYNGLYENKVAFYAVSAGVVGVAYLLYRME